MTDTSAAARPPSDVDRIADEFLAASVDLSPLEATYLGIPGHDEDLDDLSPAGIAAQSDLRRATLAKLADTVPTDDVDKVTIAAMRERLGLAEEIYAAGLDEMSLNVIASPLQSVRDIFDLMPQDSDQAWSTFAIRMTKVPQALAGYEESLVAARDKRNVTPRRQVLACAKQCRELVAEDGYFGQLVRQARSGDRELSDPVKTALADATTDAAAAYAHLADRLERDLLPHAPSPTLSGATGIPLSPSFS